jgi:type I restriction-modification system DNA methylase subunit
MKLTDEQKKAIEEEHKQYEALQYAGRSKEERQKLGQFYTPPPLSIKMLEKFDSVKDKDILDPTVGAGGLLVAAILAGADPKRVYGVDLDPINVLLARKRLAKYGVPSKHIKLGNALNSDVFEDFDNYEDDVEEKAKEAIAKLKEKKRRRRRRRRRQESNSSYTRKEKT